MYLYLVLLKYAPRVLPMLLLQSHDEACEFAKWLMPKKANELGEKLGFVGRPDAWIVAFDKNGCPHDVGLKSRRRQAASNVSVSKNLSFREKHLVIVYRNCDMPARLLGTYRDAKRYVSSLNPDRVDAIADTLGVGLYDAEETEEMAAVGSTSLWQTSFVYWIVKFDAKGHPCPSDFDLKPR